MHRRDCVAACATHSRAAPGVAEDGDQSVGERGPLGDDDAGIRSRSQSFEAGRRADDGDP